MIVYIALITVLSSFALHGSGVSKTTFVPLSVTYDPVFEQALHLYQQKCTDKNLFAVQFLTQASTGGLSRYFMIDNKSSLNVQEIGSGDVGSLWFKVISSNPSMYSSCIRMSPQRVQIGAIFTGSFDLSPWIPHLRFAFNTALINAQHRLNFRESPIQNVGTVPGIASVTESLCSEARQYSKIFHGWRSKTSLDDIQVKFIRDYLWYAGAISPYFLLGIPTGFGTKAEYLFEPLVGSKHVHLGLGTTGEYSFLHRDNGQLALLGEIKWHYACSAHETRACDLASNGQWSRYLLLVKESDPFSTFFASNDLAFRTRVTPRNTINLWLALHAERNNLQGELGYGFTCRQQEKVSILYGSKLSRASVGIADLVGIAQYVPTSASTATISEGAEPGVNPAPSDPTFTALSILDVHQTSAAQSQTISNKIYGSLAYSGKHVEFTSSVSYEQGQKPSALNQLAFWFGVNVIF